jgi:hypothetical protein
MKIYTLTELAWIHTNFAVLPAAIAEVNQLLPSDIKSITAKYAAMTAGDEMVMGLRLRANAVVARRVDRVTVAFAAAYLDHYATAIPDMDDRVTDNKVAKLLLHIIMKHTRVERGDAGALTLKCYDTEGAYLSEVMDNTDRQKRPKWLLKGPNLPVLNITRADLATLSSMSVIVSANIGTCYRSYTALVADGRHDNPFAASTKVIGYYCAGEPLYNRHYLTHLSRIDAISWPVAMPRMGVPCLPPRMSRHVALHSCICGIQIVIRKICRVNYAETDDTAGQLHASNRQTECLRYHNALFLHMLDSIGKAFVLYEEADHQMRSGIITGMRATARLMTEFSTQGLFDVTTDNSSYTSTYLRMRHKVLADHILALNPLRLHPAPTQPRPEAPGPAANPVGGIE